MVGFHLYAGVTAKAHECKRLEQLCRVILLSPLVSEKWTYPKCFVRRKTKCRSKVVLPCTQMQLLNCVFSIDFETCVLETGGVGVATACSVGMKIE
jgi:hypothetical protein